MIFFLIFIWFSMCSSVQCSVLGSLALFFEVLALNKYENREEEEEEGEEDEEGKKQIF